MRVKEEEGTTRERGVDDEVMSRCTRSNGKWRRACDELHASYILTKRDAGSGSDLVCVARGFSFPRLQH